MAKKSTSYRCTECGNEVAKWVGRCPECQAWGTIDERGAPNPALATIAAGAPSSPARPIGEIDIDFKLHQARKGKVRIDFTAREFDLLRYFPDEAARMSAADIGYLKPHPRVFEYAVEQLGTRVEETIYVGDNPVADIAGAQGAGLRAVLRVNHPAPPLISGLIVPDAAINALSELLALVEDWEAHANPGAY